MVTNNSIWYEKYKPKSISDVVLPQELKDRFSSYLQSGNIPNMAFFSSGGGTGKSSTTHVLVNELDAETLWINASLERSIDVIRGKIQTFVSSVSFDDRRKVVVMDEIDNLSHDAQMALRGFTDEFSINVTFIITGNYKERIIPQLLERFDAYDFGSFPKSEMIPGVFLRLCFILDSEGVEYNREDLKPIISSCYPSLRRMITLIQRFSSSGKLSVSVDQIDTTSKYSDLLESVKLKDFRSIVSKSNSIQNPDDFYTYMYENIDSFPPSKMAECTIIVAKYAHMSMSVRDKNLNLSACCAELSRLI